MKLKLPKIFLYFLGAIFVLNLVQSYFTELIYDESYYWYYAQNMAWGYFDHPPMVALLIKVGSFFFDGELGVRFVSCILSALTYILLWTMVDHEKKKDYVRHFFVLVFSMTLLNAYGFFTLPDTPLLFFTTAFLLTYKNFVKSPTVLLSIIMGVLMACLMYSKYHAVLVILFVLFSNLKLVFNKLAWLSIFVALLCYTPHFIWLFNNDFISIKYHLFERHRGAYNFTGYTLGYFLNLVAIFGFTFPWIYYALYKNKLSDKFTKALVYLIYGILLFFFVSSFNRKVQTQWIIIISIPLVIIVFNYILQNEKFRKTIYTVGLVNIAILLFLRIGMVYEPIFPIVYETHGNREWVEKVQSEVGDIPVVFENSYRNPAIYSFYSGKKAYSLNNIFYRKNQFSIDASESTVQNQKVLYVSYYVNSGDISYTERTGDKYFGNYIENFESFRKLACYVEEEFVSMDMENELTLKVYNPYSFDIPLEKLKFGVGFLDEYRVVKDTKTMVATPKKESISILKSMDTTYFNFKIPKSKLTNPSYFKIGIAKEGLYLGLNGNNINLD
ncbi:MAG: glycosyltransferase family 39 protein [Cellulophaga sp.]